MGIRRVRPIAEVMLGVRLGLLALGIGACAAPAPVPLPSGQLELLRAEAEAARGLHFQGPVEARLLPPAGLVRVLREELDAALGSELARRDAAVKETLGLLPPGTDLRRATLDFQSRAVVGFYAPIRRRLYVVETPGSPALSREAALVAVHELVHALQDVHFDLLDVLLGLTEHDDLAFALGALLEGDAIWAGFRYEETARGLAPLAPADLARDYGVEYAAAAHPDAPRLLRETFLLQYPAGYELVSRLVEAGGVAALDAALRDPPLTSAELLHPELHLDARRPRGLLELPVESALARGDCERLGANSFGEVGLGIWARERSAGLAASEALASGWDADRAVVLDCREGRVFAWLVQLDDPGAASRFAEQATPLAEGLGADTGLAAAARVDASGRRVLLSAGVGLAARARLLVELEGRAFADLDAFLEAHPEIAERARALRRRGGRLR